MNHTRLLTLTLALTLLLNSSAAQESPLLNMLWNNSIQGAVGKSTLVAFFVSDINNDGLSEAVVVTSGSAGMSVTKDRNRVIAFYGNGSIYWDYKVDDVIRDGIMYDINNDQYQEFVISSGQTLYNIQRGTIRIIDHQGDLIRSYDSTSLMSSLAVTDTNKDGYYEILGGSTLKVILFHMYGERVWIYPPENKGGLPAPAEAVATGDVDGDGRIEMIIGADRVYYLGDYGGLIKTYDVDPSETLLKKGFKSVRVIQLGGKGYASVIAFTKKNTVHALTVGNAFTTTGPQGSEKEYESVKEAWSLTFDSDINAIQDYDVNADGYQELILGCANGRIYAVSGSGRIIWEYPSNGNIGDIILGDIDNDNVSDIIAGTYAGSVYTLDLNGNFKWKHDTPTPILKVGVGELNGDDTKEVVVVKEDNIIEAYGLNKTFVLIKKAENYFSIGQEYYLTSDYEKAKDYFTRAKQAYLEVGYEKGVSDSERLIEKVEANLKENQHEQADIYYNKAQDYFVAGDYDSALAFEKKAKEIYLEFGDSEKVLKCELMELRIKNANNKPITPSTITITTETTPSTLGGITIDRNVLSVLGLLLLATIVIIYLRRRGGEEEELITDTLQKPADPLETEPTDEIKR